MTPPAFFLFFTGFWAYFVQMHSPKLKKTPPKRQARLWVLNSVSFVEPDSC
jgi:hypothetical protein